MVRATHGPRNRRKPWPVDPSKRPLQVETRLGLISSFPTEGIPTTNKGYPTPSGRGVDSQKQQSLVGFVFAPADFEAILATTLRRVITEELANLQDNDEVIDKEGAAKLLKVSPSTIERRVKAGQIPRILAVEALRFRRIDLLKSTAKPPDGKSQDLDENNG